jgi:hypothetical protein
MTTLMPRRKGHGGFLSRDTGKRNKRKPNKVRAPTGSMGDKSEGTMLQILRYMFKG